MTKIKLGQKILIANEEFAQKNQKMLNEKKIRCLNMISSPGSGKTSILVRTINELKSQIRIGVIEGDIKTDTDAAKIRATGAYAIQIETRGACHLSAEQVANTLKGLPADELDVVFIENVGNLVCPSDFYLGENRRVVLLSVPEGDDKPIKYPGTFAKADAILINKIDLIDYIDFDMDRAIKDIRKVNPNAAIFHVSAVTGQGMEQWYDWLRQTKKQGA